MGSAFGGARPWSKQLAASLALALALGCVAGVLVALTGCGHPAGTPCEIVGSGFTARHDCAHKCLSRWRITCPDGERVISRRCSGAFGCKPGGCPEDQVCFADEDPFEARSYCVMADTCGALTPIQRAAWERDSLARQQRLVAEREARLARRRKAKAAGEPATAAPAADLHDSMSD